MPHGGTVMLETSNVHLDQVYSLVHSDVDPGDYVVCEIQKTGWTQTDPDPLNTLCAGVDGAAASGHARDSYRAPPDRASAPIGAR